jgi:hypothetical protein
MIALSCIIVHDRHINIINFTMKHITRCFSQDLIKICHQSFKSQKWQFIICEFLNTPLANHVMVGEFKKGKLLLVVDCPLWASELRMRISELRDFLRKEQNCYDLMFIQVKIEPEFFKKSNN